jgi:KUP system potassium uptake protein
VHSERLRWLDPRQLWASAGESSAPRADADARLRTLMLAALGVVYGDIGTSPLYAVRECFHGQHASAPTPANVLGVMSLIVWSLLLVISLKYLVLIMRADNRGEGGILALMALVAMPDNVSHRRPNRALVLMGLFGAALLYGDGVITPAISVLSAIEGLNVVTPAFERAVLPLTVGILIGLFAVQRRGTAGVGRVFGPLMLVWFGVLGALGLASLAQTPDVLRAVHPAYALHFFTDHGSQAFLVMGTVFLVVTGGEALYADMGHFGRAPIRRVWFALVLPALLLNYLGQGALLLRSPELAPNPFYYLAPGWALVPLVGLATAATAVASQAVITGAYSLTWQAVQLGYLPRVRVQHTSGEEIGQVYIPSINWALLALTIALVLGFRTSSNLASAYGVAVTTTMVITSVLAYFAMREVWRWSALLAGSITAFFLTLDLAYFGANMLKVADGGWFPLIAAAGVMLLMTTWSRGRALLGARLRERSITLEELMRRASSPGVVRLPRTLVFLTGPSNIIPPALLRVVQQLGALPRQFVLITVLIERVPYVEAEQRVRVEPLSSGAFRVFVRYGFMQVPNVPVALRLCAAHDLPIDPLDVIYVIGRETLFATERPGMWLWRERLFAFMARNAGRPTDYFRIPPGQVLELGTQIQL